jgi:hypothetical protein
MVGSDANDRQTLVSCEIALIDREYAHQTLGGIFLYSILYIHHTEAVGCFVSSALSVAIEDPKVTLLFPQSWFHHLGNPR